MLGAKKGGRWIVGFALETHDARNRALQKLRRKNCDLVVLNGPEAMHGDSNTVEILEASGATVARLAGSKQSVAEGILAAIDARRTPSDSPPAPRD
jgi:phosphopantothenoylcysteine decarboxylase / phosphopantothenate---cysteine ligase